VRLSQNRAKKEASQEESGGIGRGHGPNAAHRTPGKTRSREPEAARAGEPATGALGSELGQLTPTPFQ